MKKFFTYFSLSVIAVIGIYVMMEMARLSGLTPTYDGIAKLIVGETIEKTKALNSVTAVVFDFRGYDTLGETFVLFTAISCSAAVLRKGVKVRRESNEEKH
jgi:multisubunit Na+/H+ antiporter MnhB subunit